ncbi:MAG: carbohydrate kinase family protein [Terriglobia bacterium]
MKIVSIGEVLWDVLGKEEHLGGAPLNFAVHATRLGHAVFLISAVGYDERGNRVLSRMDQLKLDRRYVRRVRGHPTGFVTVKLDEEGRPQFIIHRPAAYDFAALSTRDLAAIRAWKPDWIYFGTLFQMGPRGRELTRTVMATCRESRGFYDVNLRAGCYEPALVRKLAAAATVMKLNTEEVREVGTMLGFAAGSEFCRRAAHEFHLDAVAVTRGACGCALLLGSEYVEATGYAVKVVDAIGAGDAFAAALLHGIANRWRAIAVADFANRVGALVASRPGAIPPWSAAEAEAFEATGKQLGAPPSHGNCHSERSEESRSR